MHANTTARATLFIIGNLFAIPLYAQSHDHPAVTPVAAATADTSSAASKQAFALIKSLAGRWQGNFPNPETKQLVPMELSLRVTSHGNSVVHEMKGAGDPDGSDKIDHPVTMMYLDGANLILTHFCDAGNRPRMSARISPDGKAVDFDFLDVAGPTTHGHMQHARFTFVDSNHHVEEWTWATPSGKTMSVPLDLHRIENIASLPAK